MKKKTYIIIVFLLLALFIQKQWSHSKHCSLCNSLPYHEPCIISLASGDIIPMSVYDSHPSVLGELADEQTSGYSSIVQYSNYLGYRDTNIHHTICKVQIQSANPHWRSFCRSCREQLSNYSQTGFVMADLQKPQMPEFYPLESESSITLRCYFISTIFDPMENEFQISIQGTLEEIN